MRFSILGMQSILIKYSQQEELKWEALCLHENNKLFILESLKIQKSLTLTIYSPFQILQHILQLIQITLQH